MFFTHVTECKLSWATFLLDPCEYSEYDSEQTRIQTLHALCQKCFFNSFHIIVKKVSHILEQIYDVDAASVIHKAGFENVREEAH